MKLTAEELKIKNEILSENELDNVNGGYILPIPLFKEIGRWFVKNFNLQKNKQVMTQQ